MKQLSIDGFDLGDPGATLRLALASPGQHRDFAKFLLACGIAESTGSAAPLGWAGWADIVECFRREMGVDVPHPSQFREALLLTDDWDSREVAFAFGSFFAWYRWETSS